MKEFENQVAIDRAILRQSCLLEDSEALINSLNPRRRLSLRRRGERVADQVYWMSSYKLRHTGKSWRHTYAVGLSGGTMRK